MKALYFDGKKLDERMIPLPVPREGEALIRINYAGICSTDLEILKGYMGFQGVPGHEFAGEVAEAESRELVGRRVVGEINIPCGRCGLCRRGLGKHCRSREVLGISGRNGVFAEYAALPERNLHIVPAGVSGRQAVFTELLAAACEFPERIPVTRDTEAAVLGDGRLAAMAVQVTADLAGRTVLIGKNRRKMETVESLGIEVESLSAALEGSGRYDLVVECTGSPRGLKDAAALVRPRGTIVLKTTLQEETCLNQSPLVVNEITVAGSRCGPFAKALDLLEEGKVRTEPFLSAELPLERWREGLTKAGQADIFKVIFRIA